MLLATTPLPIPDITPPVTRIYFISFISLKWQQSSGTAEQKVPYEFMCLADVLAKDSTIHKAYIGIGGDGWTKHQFFLNDLNDWVNTNEFVDVVRLDSFVAKANQGKL